MKILSENVSNKIINSLKEEYSERYGGDVEDFVSDMKSLIYQLRTIEIDNFGTNLAKQMVMDFEETAENQMKMCANKYNIDLEESDKSKDIKESAPYRRYKVSFYVDTNEMNNIELEEKVDELLKGSGLASADETIDVEQIEEL